MKTEATLEPNALQSLEYVRMKVVDFPIFRKANKTRVFVHEIINSGWLVLDVDGKLVEIKKEVIKPVYEGVENSREIIRTMIKCKCADCCMLGFKYGNICRRQQKAIEYMMSVGGRIIQNDDDD